MKKNIVLSGLLVLICFAAASGWPAGTASQSPGETAAPGRIVAADKDLIALLPSSTIGVLVLDFKRLLEIPPVAKAMEGPEFREFSDEVIKMSGIDLKRDVDYVGWGIPASALAGRLSGSPGLAAFENFAIIIGLNYDRARLQSLVKKEVSELKEEAYGGVAVFVPVGKDEPSPATPAVLAEVGKIRLEFALLDDHHILLGGGSGIRGVIDVYQKRAEPLTQDSELAAVMGRVDKSGVAWSAVFYPPEQAKMIAESNPLLKAVEGFKGMTMAVDDKESKLFVDLRTVGGTPEQNSAFASNLKGLKAVGALYAAQQPSLAELLNGTAVTSGDDYTRVNLAVSHETLGTLYRLSEPNEAEPKDVDWEGLLKEAEDLGREGQYDRAVEAGKLALRNAELKLGPAHPDLAKVLDKVADLYCKDDLPQHAEPLYTRSLAIREKALGPDHPDFAESLNGLAVYYEELGQDAKAVALYDRLLTIRERSLGPEHPQVTPVLDKLARLHYYQREYAKAEPLWRRSLAIRERTLGPNHPDVATNLHDLAMLFQVQGKYAAAEPLWKRALAVREKSLGPNHPDVATTLSLLAELYRATNRERDAEELEARAARILSIKR